MQGPLVVIAGGEGKGQDFTPLAPLVEMTFEDGVRAEPDSLPLETMAPAL